MERKKMFKIGAILFVIAVPIAVFNLGAIQAALPGAWMTIFWIGMFALALPFIVTIADMFFLKWRHGFARGITTRGSKALPIKKRIENARICINNHRLTDDCLTACDGHEMTIIRHEPSPCRNDAVQWDMFTFTTTQERTNWNPATGLDGISQNKLFYVIENSFVGDCYLMFFPDHQTAQDYFRNLWFSGVKKIEESGLEKQMKLGFAQTLGGEIAKKSSSSDSDEKKEGLNE